MCCSFGWARRPGHGGERVVAPSSALSGRLHGALRFAASPVGLCFVQGAWPGWAHRPAQCGQAWAKPGPARAELAWGSKGSTTCSSGQSRAWGWMGWAGLAGGGFSPLQRACVWALSLPGCVWARPPGSDTPGSFCFSLLNPPCPRSRFSPLVSLFVHPRSPHRRLRSTAHPFLFPLPTSTFAFLTTVTPLKIIGTISLDSLEIRSFLPVSICFVSCLFSLLFFALGPAFFLLRSRGPLFHNTIPRPDALPPARTPFVQDDTPLQRPIFSVFFYSFIPSQHTTITTTTTTHLGFHRIAAARAPPRQPTWDNPPPPLPTQHQPHTALPERGLCASNRCLGPRKGQHSF